MARIDNASIDLIIADLPYGITARNDWDKTLPFDKLWEQYERVVKDTAAIILFSSGIFTGELMMSKPELFRYTLVWEKTTPTGFLNARRMPLRIHEDILVFYRKLPTYNPQKTFGHPRKVSKAEHKLDCVQTLNYHEYNLATYDSTERFPTSVLRFKTDKQKLALHPTQKPLALIEYLVLTYSNEGDTILDNCLGSGTTAEAALRNNRNIVGFEVMEQYYLVTLDRIKKLDHRDYPSLFSDGDNHLV